MAVLPDAALVPPAALPLRSQPGSARGEIGTGLAICCVAAALTKRRACGQLLGFPLPGDGYWNEHTVAAVGQRYPEMEMGPYAAALLAAARL